MVMGPQSRSLLTRLTDADLSKDIMPWMSVSEISFAGINVTAMRVSYVGELGWEIHLSSEDLPHVYQEIQENGQDLGIIDFGSYALNVMRLEKGYHGWGSDFGTEYTLYDAKLEGFVNWKKEDFIGRDAVLKQSQSQSEWELFGFVIYGDDADAHASDPIFQNDKWVGFVTSACTGFRIGKRIALGYIKTAEIQSDQSYTIKILGEQYPAEQVSTPFYDPENQRLRS